MRCPRGFFCKVKDGKGGDKEKKRFRKLRKEGVGKAAATGQDLQAAFPVKTPRGEGCFGYKCITAAFLRQSDPW